MKQRRKKNSDPVGPLRLLGKRSTARAKLQQEERLRAAKSTSAASGR